MTPTKRDGFETLEDLCLSVPCIVSKDGVEGVLLADLTEQERNALLHSASVLKESFARVME